MKLISQLNQHFGKTIRDGVIRDIASSALIGPTNVSIIIKVAALLIVITPYLVAAIGFSLIVIGYQSILSIVLGLLLLSAGFYLRPLSHQNTEHTLRREELPTLFALLDSISAKLESPKIDGVHINSHFNAYVEEFKNQEYILGIGAPLWIALEPSERLAILSHEIAHLINNDPARGRLTGDALITLARWVDLFEPPALLDYGSNSRIIIDDRGVITQIVCGIFGGVVKGIAYTYEKLVFADSQRAEYLADLKSASVSGASANMSTLKKLILAPLAYEALANTYYDGSKSVPVFEIMGNAVRAADKDKSDKLYSDAVNSLHTVDSTHPPTRYRMEIVGAAGASNPSLDTNNIDWDRIDNELSVNFGKEESKTLSQILVQ